MDYITAIILWRCIPLVIITALIMTVKSKDDEKFLGMTYSPSGKNILWPRPELQTYLKSCGKYDPAKMLPTRFQIYNDEVIYTFPRFRPGVPFTLGRMKMCVKDRWNPEISPYPNWEAHDDVQNTNAIRNSVDMYVDTNDKLWVLDAGVVNTLENPIVQMKPRVIGIDLMKKQVSHLISLSPLVSSVSRLQFIVAEVVDDDTVLYISDAGTMSLLMYYTSCSKGIKIVLPTIASRSFLKRDAMYMVLGRKSECETYLYLTYLCSTSVYSIATKNLRDRKHPWSMIKEGCKPGKIIFLGTDNGQNLFFRYQGDNLIYVWDITQPFTLDNFSKLDRSTNSLLATQVVAGKDMFMWVIESNFQDFIKGKIGCKGINTIVRPIAKMDCMTGKRPVMKQGLEQNSTMRENYKVQNV